MHRLVNVLIFVAVMFAAAVITGLVAGGMPSPSWAKGLALLTATPVLGWAMMPARAVFGPNPQHRRLRVRLFIHAALMLGPVLLLTGRLPGDSPLEPWAALAWLALLGNAGRLAFSRAAYVRMLHKAGEAVPPPPAAAAPPPAPETARERLVRESRAMLDELTRDAALLEQDSLFRLLDDIRFRYRRILDRVAEDPEALEVARPALIEWLPVVGSLADNFRQLSARQEISPERLETAERELAAFGARLDTVHDRLFEAVELRLDSDLRNLNRM